MKKSNEIGPRLHHGASELREALLQLAAVTVCVQTASAEIGLCHDLANQIHTDAEESNQRLKQENAKLKQDLAALLQTLDTEKEQHKAHLARSIKLDKAREQQFQRLERANGLLMDEISTMKERMIPDYAKLRRTVADQAETIKKLRSSPSSKVIPKTTATTNDFDGGNANGIIPSRKGLLDETNRGPIVKVKSTSPSISHVTSLRNGPIPRSPKGSAFPLPPSPNTVAEPRSMSLTRPRGRSTGIAMPAPIRPKASAFIRGTREANESFERMRSSLLPSPLANSTNYLNLDEHVAEASSMPASSLATATVNPFGVHPFSQSKSKFKLNPAVSAFAPPKSGGKDSAKSGDVQASSLSQADLRFPVDADRLEEKGFMPPHLKRLFRTSTEEAPVITAGELSAKAETKAPGTVVPSDQRNFAKMTDSFPTPFSDPRVPPHLRALTRGINSQDLNPFQLQRSDKEDTVEEYEFMSRESVLPNIQETEQAPSNPGAFVVSDPGLQAWLDTQEKARPNNPSSNESASLTNDSLIDFDHEESLPTSEKKLVPLPPGFIPMSDSDTSARNGPTARTTAYSASSPVTVPGRSSSRYTAPKPEKAVVEPEIPEKSMSENEKTAAFLAEYDKMLGVINSRYQRHSRQSLSDAENGIDPLWTSVFNPVTDDSSRRIIGTHDLGSLLDDECSRMVLQKPRKAVQVPDFGQQWRPIVRKDGRVVFVL